MTGALAAWQQLDQVERVARCRAAATAARLLVGPAAGAELLAALALAELDPAALPSCDRALASMPSIPARRILATIAATLPARGGLP